MLVLMYGFGRIWLMLLRRLFLGSQGLGDGMVVLGWDTEGDREGLQ